jgi:hypothetical protein
MIQFLKLKVKVDNQKLQSKLDKVNGWREVALVVASVIITAATVWLAFKYKVLP